MGTRQATVPKSRILTPQCGTPVRITSGGVNTSQLRGCSVGYSVIEGTSDSRCPIPAESDCRCRAWGIGCCWSRSVSAAECWPAKGCHVEDERAYTDGAFACPNGVVVEGGFLAALGTIVGAVGGRNQLHGAEVSGIGVAFAVVEGGVASSKTETK